MKNGLQSSRVVIKASNDFLNWADRVGVRFLVSDPMLNSSEKIDCKKRFLETWTN
jgi:hypothetical protein